MIPEHQNRRQNPDRILEDIRQSDARETRARLKIFLGMAAGVGKTYAMLSQAREALVAGMDVVVGIVETHGRADTGALLEGLPAMPRATVEYGGATFGELDTDALLVRRPALVLVDELAHTNLRGSRHAKRYQDVLELLEAGIEVWTTLNVQHVESLAGDVELITGTKISETVPDSMLDRADAIELVDLPPSELLLRMDQGKVYGAERIPQARANFFRIGNLTALRELALRVTARRVDRQLRAYMNERHIPGPWKAHECVLVAVGGSPYAVGLIRAARRMADAMECSWIAVHVHGRSPTGAKETGRLTEHLRLARELGAEVVTTSAHDPAEGILQVARDHNVTRIIAGKPQSGNLLSMLVGADLVTRLIRDSGAIDVVVVPAEHTVPGGWRQALPRATSGVGHYAVSTGAVFMAALVCYIFRDAIGYQSVAMVMLLILALLPLAAPTRGPLISAAVLATVIWDYFFIPPQLTLYISSVEDVLLSALLLVTGTSSGFLSARVREREHMIRQRERRVTEQYALARALAHATSVGDVVDVAQRAIATSLEADCAIRAVQEQVGFPSEPMFGEGVDAGVPQWVYDHRTSAGAGTKTLGSAQATYHPLLVHERCVGVVGVRMPQDRSMTVEQEGLLVSFLQQIAGTMERELLRASQERARMAEERDRLNRALLNSISHELRTPLATIAGAAALLKDERTAGTTTSRNALVDELTLASERLNRLVANLLDMSRLEAGSLGLRTTWTDIRDVVVEARRQLQRELRDHPVTVDIPGDVPDVMADARLMEQALVNLLLNAVLYTGTGTPITVTVHADDAWLYIEVADRGPGIPEEALPHLFDKFYRLPNSRAGGTGLGLSIVKGFVDAHRGTIRAGNRPDGGAVFVISLPRS